MTDSTTLELTRLIDAPIARVWDAWVDPVKFAQWWVPHPWSAEILQHDVWAGGGFSMQMISPDGQKLAAPGCFLLVEEQARIVFTSTMSEGFQPVESSFPMTAQILMRADGDQTHYTARVLHPTEAGRKQHEEMGFEGGWGAALSQLEQLLRS
ncbi:Uncharacterized conserved protein YndB, AHSA1/START domain [Monaibacterium marinum]|uniref:Uncharacterized conserved protein YndB, AHSA1/START domain n=1 Tax=Pontivivens marinum TaxID=1690039 RepID=A0A2C9CPL4_9RHOB|nr:SRPBCC domain-containing protein [Monaibacterium marinum]SOH93158.1 Uncharacterized conserved protein YndB, AHSA1/START domain [Monaibacterium marinum]